MDSSFPFCLGLFFFLGRIPFLFPNGHLKSRHMGQVDRSEIQVQTNLGRWSPNVLKFVSTNYSTFSLPTIHAYALE